MADNFILEPPNRYHLYRNNSIPGLPMYNIPRRNYIITSDVWVVFRTKTVISLNDTFEVVGVFDSNEAARLNSSPGDTIKGPIPFYGEQRIPELMIATPAIPFMGS